MSPIDPRLQEALDGERDPGDLPVDLREAYARLNAATQILKATPPVSVASRVMAEIRQNPARIESDGPARRLIRWLGEGRAVTVRLRPVWTLALAAGLGAVLERGEQVALVERALAALPAEKREAFVLKHVEGMSYEEMATVTGARIPTLKMRVHRAREALLAALEEVVR